MRMTSCGQIVEHCFLCFSILSLTPGNFGNTKHRGHYTHVSDYETLIPSKVDARGAFQSFDIPHFYDLEEARFRRSTATEPIYVRYSLQFNGRKHLVELWPNHRFLSPGLVTERRRRNLWRTADMKSAHHKQCHYVGRVFGHPRSRAALSACHEGLAGYVKTGDIQFFVEPAAGTLPDVDGRHVHIAFRAETTNSDRNKRRDPVGTPNCGVEDDWKTAWKNRFEWELQTNPNFLVNEASRASALAPRFLKLLVVVDKKFIVYHKDHNPETYILTLMNMVSDYYHDASLGRALEIVVVRIMYLEEEEEELDLTISHDAGKTLESFKRWSQRVNPRDVTHPNHHNIAVLLTRHDICSSDSSNCDILGVASVAAACQPSRAACINEDSGLMTGVTIAHEIGHVMGCAHDRKLKEGDEGCEPFAPDGSAYVMSVFLKPRTSIWSKCSRRYVEMLINTGMVDCLLQEPVAHPFQLPEMPPGAMYDANYQCRDLLGAVEVCPSKKDEICRLLWCKIDARTCAAPGRPAADGTKCDEGFWCYGGECVEIGRRPAATDGHWSSWGPWSTCSRTCGGGIQRSQRFCNNPAPRNKGRLCVGEGHRYRVCNHSPCDPNEPNFREVQCSAFNGKPFEGQLFNWTPHKELRGRECELLCFSGSDFYVSLSPLAKDGTPCRSGTKDMCVSGQCLHVGCDWVLGSENEEDICGECGGDGSHCRLITKLFSKPNGIRYVKIGSVPVNSRHIKVEELKPTINTIAVANKNGNKFYINGNYTEYANGEYSFGSNVRGVYTHPESEREVLTIKGPTPEELSVYAVFYGSKNPGVRISYYERNVVGTLRKPSFEWEFLEWGPCSARCGGGSQIAEPSCVETNVGKVSASFCNQSVRPQKRSRICNPQKCAVHWYISPWGPCSSPLSGMQHRKVECKAENPNIKHKPGLVESSECIGFRPPDTRPCYNISYSTSPHTSLRYGKTKRTTAATIAKYAFIKHTAHHAALTEHSTAKHRPMMPSIENREQSSCCTWFHDKHTNGASFTSGYGKQTDVSHTTIAAEKSPTTYLEHRVPFNRKHITNVYEKPTTKYFKKHATTYRSNCETGDDKTHSLSVHHRKLPPFPLFSRTCRIQNNHPTSESPMSSITGWYYNIANKDHNQLTTLNGDKNNPNTEQKIDETDFFKNVNKDRNGFIIHGVEPSTYSEPDDSIIVNEEDGDETGSDKNSTASNAQQVSKDIFFHSNSSSLDTEQMATESPSTDKLRLTSQSEFVIDLIPDSHIVLKEALLIGSISNNSLSDIVKRETSECRCDTLDTSHQKTFSGKKAVDRPKEKKQVEKHDPKIP